MDGTGWHALRAAHATYQQPYEQNPDGSYRRAYPPFPRVSANPFNEPAYHQDERREGDQRHKLSTISAVHRSNYYLPVSKMHPHLQLLCGPLLRYDTIENGIWYGAIMVVTADAGSIYEPHPRINLEYDPVHPSTQRVSHPPVHHSLNPSLSSSHASHPSNLYGGSPYPPPSSSTASTRTSMSTRRVDALAEVLWVYHGPYGPCTFWRAMLQIPLARHEMTVTYRINGGEGIQFVVPRQEQELRWAAYSCNGFSAGVNADDFKGPGHASGFDPVWSDLLEKHAEKPFHALVGGGDQLYCDSLLREPELQEFVNLKTKKEKIAYQVSDALRLAVDRFYFSHYCIVFRLGKFAQANSTIPMINMIDDHDIVDGFGSYPEETQRSPLFQVIGDRAYHYFLLFQCFVNDEVDGVDVHPRRHRMRSMLLGGPGVYIPYPSHSVVTYLGPSTSMIMLDCRAERTVNQVCSETTYRRMFDRLWELPRNVKHVVIQLGIPIAYPRMDFVETALESPFNPIVVLGKKDKLGLGSVVNVFNKDAELLDDLVDHWTAKTHKKERNWLIEQIQKFALLRQIRVSFLSGDVHCAAVGVLKTLSTPASQSSDPVTDHRYMINVVTSAIVNTPPPNAVLDVVESFSNREHKTMHYANTDESMIPLFSKDTDGKPRKSKNIMGRRNYAIVEYDTRTNELCFDIRMEKAKGIGTTVGYAVRAPRPGWQAP